MLTWVTGEPGIGKTRLVKTFLHRATSEGAALVLQGHGHERVPPVAYASLAQALDDAVTHEMEVAELLLERLPPDRLRTLALLVPALDELRPETGPRRRPRREPGDLFAAVAEALVALTHGPDGERRPVILFLDDLQASGRAMRELLGSLEEPLGNDPVWVVAAQSARSAAEATAELAPPAEPGSAAGTGPAGSRVHLDRLAEEDLHVITAGLVPERHEELDALLAGCDGLPLAITETINWLWDEGYLVEHQGGTWSLERIPPPGEVPATLEEIVQARLAELPTSTRRLFTLAAVAGPEVDAELLEAAEREHGVVVDNGIRVLLERWMGRLRLGYWADSRRERDVSLWTSGTRRRTFEFAHPLLREIVYAALDPDRRAVLHRRVAEAFEDRLLTGASPRRSEILGFHYALGCAWGRALPHLEAAAEAALALGAPATAGWYRDRATEALAALAEERPDDTGAWKEVRMRWRALGESIRDASSAAGA
jgi:predicted ATPase